MIIDYIIESLGHQKPKIIVTNKGFDGKTDPTQYSIDKNIIYVKPSYDIPNDNEGWMVHEFAHSNFNIADDGKDYPYNNTEKYAYTKQFNFLKHSKGINDFDELKDSSKFPTLSIKILS
jgi:hypothetical protein